jgi:hypothetical protein
VWENPRLIAARLVGRAHDIATDAGDTPDSTVRWLGRLVWWHGSFIAR